MRLPKRIVVTIFLAAGVSTMSCDMGPFPDFLEPLDPLVPLEGDANGWILAEEGQTQILVFGEGGQFLHSVIERNTAVVVELGTIQVESSTLTMRSTYRYEFPKESGPVTSRLGAQSGAIDVVTTREATITDSTLTIEGMGTFLATADFVTALDLGLQHDRGCLMKFVQLSLRTAQARIRNFGGSGTAIYHNNEAKFSGFLGGEESILLENILSPDTSIRYTHFSDFPEVELGGVLLSHVNSSGSGHLDEFNTFEIFGSTDGASGLSHEGGATGAATGSVRPLLISGRLIYATSDPVEIKQGDVSGGNYEFVLGEQQELRDTVVWSFLEDLDLRGCYQLPEPSETAK